MFEYIRKLWKNNSETEITAEALNNMEEGIERANNGIYKPNIVINGDFQLNQRLASVYTNSTSKYIYTVDRWKISFGVQVALYDGYIRVSSKEDGGGYFAQTLEKALNGIYTLSAYVKDISGNVSMCLGGVDGDIKLQKGFNVITVDDSNISEVVFNLKDNGSYIELEWVKLEQGPVATQFVPRLYGEELILCKRYFQKLYIPWVTSNKSIQTKFAGCIFPVTMRIDPTFVSYQFSNIYNDDITDNIFFITKDKERILTIETNEPYDAIYGEVLLDAEIY